MKLKTYILMLAKNFPSHHYKGGQPTNFYQKVLDGEKIHTIRINAENWQRKIEEVNAGRAIISIREWSGKPYEKGTSQIELFQLHTCWFENIEKGRNYLIVDESGNAYIEDLNFGKIQNNDGLSVPEFNAWFKKIDTGEQLIIIHFTDFRYVASQPLSDSYIIHTNK
jgi:hypothetical protein